MTAHEQNELVQTVERQIASLLADLEKRTGCYVEGLQVKDIEVTLHRLHKLGLFVLCHGDSLIWPFVAPNLSWAEWLQVIRQTQSNPQAPPRRHLR